MVLEDVFIGQERVNGLQVIGQSIVSASEIEPFIFNARSEIPISGNEKPMRVTELIIERIAIAERPPIVLKIAASGVKGFVIENLG
jgi:hypothetical protein